MLLHDIQTKLVTQVEIKSGNWPNDIGAIKLVLTYTGYKSRYVQIAKTTQTEEAMRVQRWRSHWFYCNENCRV